MKDVPQQILDLQKEISALSKKTFKKLTLLDSVAKDTLDNPGDNVIHLPFHYEETKNHYRLRIKTGTEINGTVYIPKSLKILPDKLVLTKKPD